MNLINQILGFLAHLFVFAVGLGVLAIAVIYVIGRFRYFFAELGEFFRQNFFAMDREEMPFNRAERS